MTDGDEFAIKRAALEAELHEELLSRRVEYVPVYSPKAPETCRRWRRNHPGKMRETNAKRRTLGYIALNAPFFGSEGHHIDRERVVSVPKELHRSVSHNVRTGWNMEKINGLVKEWSERVCAHINFD